MDLVYSPEDEAFRAEIRDWLSSHLPAGWGDEGFELSPLTAHQCCLAAVFRIRHALEGTERSRRGGHRTQRVPST